MPRPDHPSERGALSEQLRAILELERTWWTGSASKAAEIRRRLGISPSSYYRLLAEALDDPVALAHDPLVIKRLRRQRDLRRRRRFEGPTRDRGMP
jgi:hypothetical protein